MSTNTTPRPGTVTQRGTYAGHPYEIRFDRITHVDGARVTPYNAYRVYVDGFTTGGDFDVEPTVADVAAEIVWRQP